MESYPENLPQPTQPGLIPTVIQPQGLMRHDGSSPIAPPTMSPAPQVPGIPASFNAPGGPGCPAGSSPFDEDAGPQTPNVRPSGPYGHQPGQAYAQGGNFNIYGHGLPLNRVHNSPALWKPSYKKNKDLHKLDATISGYTKWAQSIFDHLSRTNRGWPQLLKLIEQQEKPVLYKELTKQQIGGLNSWDIACNLET